MSQTMGKEEEAVHEACPVSYVSHGTTKAPTCRSILNMILNIERYIQPRGFAPGPPRLRRDRLTLQPPTDVNPITLEFQDLRRPTQSPSNPAGGTPGHKNLGGTFLQAADFFLTCIMRRYY